MVPMALIWWIYHFWARFWPYFNLVDFRAYFGPFSLVNRVQFSNADAGAWNSFLRLGIIFYGKLMHKDTKFCYSSFDISTFGFKAPPYCSCMAKNWAYWTPWSMIDVHFYEKEDKEGERICDSRWRQGICGDIPGPLDKAGIAQKMLVPFIFWFHLCQ